MNPAEAGLHNEADVSGTRSVRLQPDLPSSFGAGEPRRGARLATALPEALGPRGSDVMTWLRLFLLMLVALPLAGCEAIGDIFQAGMAVGVIMILVVVGVIAFIVAKIKN